MFRFDKDLRVYLHRAPIDFRAGINSLAVMVEQALEVDPFAKAVYVFRNRRRDRVKILAWDRNGFWMMLKRLEEDADTMAGAHAGANLYSLLQTCQVNGVDGYRYLRALLVALPAAKTADDHAAVLPWRIACTDARD